MTLTTRLYYAEPWRREFEARVVEMRQIDQGGVGARVAVLDRSAFYPTSGGQPFDTGTLGGVRVTGVEEADEGVVLHQVEADLPVGSTVRGVIDWPRRFDHMQQHTGQHVLSAAFDRLHGARTESFHLGTEVSTIDLGRDVSARDIERAEDLANEVTWGDRPVGIRFVSDEEAARMPFRKPPTKTGRIRVIDVEGVDVSACGGTHVSRTGEVGLIAVRGWERYKGGTRIEFVCGGRALAAYRGFRDAVTGAIRSLSVFPHELPDAIARLQAANKDAAREVKKLREDLGAHEGRALAASAVPVGALHLVLSMAHGYDAGTLKPLVSAACDRDGGVAVLFAGTAPSVVAAARHASAAGVDCGALVKALCARFGGKGGGRPDMAQGGGLVAPADELLSFARAWIAERATLSQVLSLPDAE
jgi:alanyl-tRNA synthetase